MKTVHCSRNSTAFTLVELLICIAVLAVLAAILMPVFASARSHSRQATCLSNLLQLGSAIQMYSQDYDDLMPYALDSSSKWLLLQGIAVFGEPLDSQVKLLPDIRTVLTPYKSTNELFHCPCDKRTLELASQGAKSTWFDSDGSSYYYEDRDALLVTPISYYQYPSSTYLLGDVECFHDRAANDSGFFDVLHVDCHAKLLTIAQRQDAINKVRWADEDQ